MTLNDFIEWVNTNRENLSGDETLAVHALVVREYVCRKDVLEKRRRGDAMNRLGFLIAWRNAKRPILSDSCAPPRYDGLVGLGLGELRILRGDRNCALRYFVFLIPTCYGSLAPVKAGGTNE